MRFFENNLKHKSMQPVMPLVTKYEDFLTVSDDARKEERI